MKRRHFLLSGSASAALALTGCGGGGSGDSGLSSSATGTSGSAAASGVPGIRRQIAAASTVPGVAYPFGARLVSYAGGIKPSQTNAAMDAVLTSQYDAWKAARVVSANSIVAGGFAVQFSNTAYMTVSEGMGYGMLLAVLFAGHDSQAQQVFDGMLAVVRARPAYAVTPFDPNGKYLMDWRINADGTSAGDGWNAMDGDLDIALALLMADKQWGSNGTWNYLQEGKNTIAGLQSWNMAANGATKGLPAATNDRTSDYMIGHFRAFKAATGDTLWDAAVDRSYFLLDYMQTVYSPGVGLMPDFVMHTDTPTPCPSTGYIGDGNANEGYFWWNACRNPWRYSSDYLLSGDTRFAQVTGKMISFFQASSGGDPTQIGTGYSLSGQKLTGGNSPAYHGPICAGACVDASFQGFLDQMWNWNASNLTTGYYDGEIQLLSMVVASGNWWTPAVFNGTGSTAPSSSSSSGSTPAQQTPAQQTTGAATAAASGLLVNGDFSQGLAGWNNWGNSQVVAGVLQVGTAAGGVSQDIASKLTAGTTYQLSGTACISAVGEGVYVGIKLMDASGNLLVNEVKAAGSLAPASGSITFTAPAGVASGYVFVWKNASVAVGMVSKLSLAAAGSAAAANASSSAPVAPAPGNLLANGDFSSDLASWSNWGNSQVIGGAVNVGPAAGGVAQNILPRLVPGKTYRLTGLAGVSAPSEGVFVGVRITDAAGNMLVNQTQLVSAMTATDVSLTFVAPQGATSGSVYVWKNANSAVGMAGKLVLVAV
jgi:hypothetical protein